MDKNTIEVWIRTVCLILALVNQVCVNLGLYPLSITDDTLYTLGTTAITVITALVAWWKNNSFTAAAIHGDLAKEEYKKRNAD